VKFSCLTFLRSSIAVIEHILIWKSNLSRKISLCSGFLERCSGLERVKKWFVAESVNLSLLCFYMSLSSCLAV
jgi:hypothetical protein